ncbi:Glycosyltransferase involved in cell wall bisynthesis [Bizionia echini]|uniref:Glycosyltransferase involved in cell wall bisynthesis n=1 Tax=Bizionia echini TaxID=649333 RepID=A0A1I5BCE6_9FLAO|nr:glycosyltransferase [Bizionia echini]SFN72201.1 Glycosyltransferase involved in cell wall bisynthesis [Bizionia echini]
MDDKPLVTVCMIAYNHEPYISQAIEGVLQQKTNFNFNLLISNDCSSDNTDSIIRTIQDNHPLGAKIEYYNQKMNLGIVPNFLFTLSKPESSYLAICEGDDYWIDPFKLQKQVDFLEQEAEFAGVATNSVIKYEGTSKEHLFSTKTRPILETNDLLEARPFHTATFMFRKGAFKIDFPKDILSADRALFLLVSCYGPIKYINDVTAVYRKNDGGISRRVTSKQMKQDYRIVTYIKKHNQSFNYIKLEAFIAKTVLEYSNKLFLLDFLKASYSLTFRNFTLAKGLNKKRKTIKNSLVLIYKNSGKIIF